MLSIEGDIKYQSFDAFIIFITYFDPTKVFLVNPTKAKSTHPNLNPGRTQAIKTNIFLVDLGFRICNGWLRFKT